jgi:hypothetical protein
LLILRTGYSNPEHISSRDRNTALQIAQQYPEMQEFIIELINGNYLDRVELDDFEFNEGFNCFFSYSYLLICSLLIYLFKQYKDFSLYFLLGKGNE